MSAQTRALIWEQWRIAGVTAAWMFCFSAPLMLILGTLEVFNMAQKRDAVAFSAAVLVYATLTAALVFTLRFDGAGHLSAGFDRRLGRLPIRTGPLVTIPFLTRLCYLGLLMLGLLALHWTLYREWLDPIWLILPFTCYAIAQAFAWSRRSLTGLDYLLPLALLLVPLALYWMGAAEKGYFEAFVLLVSTLASPTLAPFVLLAAFGVGFLGVHWDRRDIRRGLPTFGEIQDALSSRASITKRDTVSPLAAMVWYESRRMGARMQVNLLILVAIATVITVSVPDLRDQTSLIAQCVPLVALALVSTAHGASALWSKSRFEFLRPVETRALAQAKLIATARSLTRTALLAAVLSVAGYYLTARNAEFELMAWALERGETSLSEIAAILLGPCLLAFAIAWALCALGTGLSIALALVTAGAAMLAAGFAGILYFWLDEHDLAILVFLFMPCVLVTLSLAQAVRKQLVSPMGAATLLVLWLAVPVFLYAIGPHTLELLYVLELRESPIFGVTTAPGDFNDWANLFISTPYWAALPGLTAGALLVAPFVGVAHATHRRRTA